MFQWLIWLILLFVFLLTDGYIDFIDPSKIKSNERLFFYETRFNGLNKDKLDKIKKLAKEFSARKLEYLS